MKRSQDVDFDALLDSLNTGQVEDLKPEHEAWSDFDDDESVEDDDD